jgi:hypothetical protein
LPFSSLQPYTLSPKLHLPSQTIKMSTPKVWSRIPCPSNEDTQLALLAALYSELQSCIPHQSNPSPIVRVWATQRQDRILALYERGIKTFSNRENFLLSGESARESVMYRAWRRQPWSADGHPQDEETIQAGVFRAREALLSQLQCVSADRLRTGSLCLAIDRE